MSIVLEHDARASVLNAPSIDARAYATHARTDERTDAEGLTYQRKLALRNARRGAERNWAEVASDPNFDSRTNCPSRCTSVLQRCGRRLAALRVSQSNAQGFTVDPHSENESRSLQHHRSPSHTNAEVGVSRHLSLRSKTQRREACSPLAGWHGKSSGSNPLRPPTTSRRPVVQGRLRLAADFDSTGGYTAAPAIHARRAGRVSSGYPLRAAG